MAEAKNKISFKELFKKLFGNDEEEIDFENEKNPGIENWEELQKSYKRTKNMERDIFSSRIVEKQKVAKRNPERKVTRKKVKTIERDDSKEMEL